MFCISVAACQLIFLTHSVHFLELEGDEKWEYRYTEKQTLKVSVHRGQRVSEIKLWIEGWNKGMQLIWEPQEMMEFKNDLDAA